jgi:inner membrane protein
MTDKTHQLIGLTAATGFYLTFQPDNLITWPIVWTIIIGSFIGSIVPDIDQPTASIWNDIPLGGFLGKITQRALGGHRNLSHSLLGLGLFWLLMHWLSYLIPATWPINSPVFEISALIGFIFHLLADSVTVRGIPLFWPFGRDMGFPPYPLQGIRIITGHWFENMIVFPVVTVVLIAIIASHIGQINF